MQINILKIYSTITLFFINFKMKKNLVLIISIFTFLWTFDLVDASSWDTSTYISEISSKEDLLTNINLLNTELNSLRDDKTKSLSDMVKELTANYKEIYSISGNTQDAIVYLVDMWKLKLDFSKELLQDFNELSNDIITKVSEESSKLMQVSNQIDISIDWLSEDEIKSYWESFEEIKNNTDDIKELIEWKTIKLEKEYTDKLKNIKDSIETALKENSSSLNTLEEFKSEYEKLKSQIEKYNKNSEEFKKEYLSYSSEILSYIDDKSLEYKETLKKALDDIKDKNINVNTALSDFLNDIDRNIDFQINNFEFKISQDINETYWIIKTIYNYDVNLGVYNDIKNRYINIDSEIKASEVLSNTWALDDIKRVKSNLSSANEKLSILLEDDDSLKSLETIKSWIENELIKIYNENYEDYKNNLIDKLKEKIKIIDLENKNIVAIAEIIDIKYSLLLEKLKTLKTYEDKKYQTNSFRDYANAYKVIKSETLDKKIENINNVIDKYIIKEEIKNLKSICENDDNKKYNKMDENLMSQLDMYIWEKLKKYEDEKALNKINKVSDKLEIILASQETWKTNYILLKIKSYLLSLKLEIISK